MNEHESTCLRASPVHNNSNVRDVSPKSHTDEISGKIVTNSVPAIGRIGSDWSRIKG